MLGWIWANLTWTPKNIALVKIRAWHGHVHTLELFLLRNGYESGIWGAYSVCTAGCRVLCVPVGHNVALEVQFILEKLAYNTVILARKCTVDFIIYANMSVALQTALQKELTGAHE